MLHAFPLVMLAYGSECRKGASQWCRDASTSWIPKLAKPWLKRTQSIIRVLWYAFEFFIRVKRLCTFLQLKKNNHSGRVEDVVSVLLQDLCWFGHIVLQLRLYSWEELCNTSIFITNYNWRQLQKMAPAALPSTLMALLERENGNLHMSG